MKLIYHPNLSSKLKSFGIEVPLQDDRASKTYEFLKEKFESTIEVTDISSWKGLSLEELRLVHDLEFCQALFDKEEQERRLIECFGLFDEAGNSNRYRPESASSPLSLMIPNILLQGRGSMQAMRSSLEKDENMCFFLGGGMHHAMAAGGRGFCLINDIVIGVRQLQKEKLIKNAWVIDIDAHKGDGTAALTVDDKSISTLSIHMEKGWPLDDASGEGPWRLPSSIDIPVSNDRGDQYLELLEAGLKKLRSNFGPTDIAIVVAGADPFEKDVLPSSSGLSLTLEELLERDKLVYHFLLKEKIPQCWLMAGGYGPDSWMVYSQFISYVLGSKA